MSDIFDELGSSKGDIFDEVALRKTAVPEDSVRPGDVEARKRQLGMDTSTPANVVRERQTISGEISGGLQQTLDDVLTMINPQENDMSMIERLAHGARAPLGLLRAAAPVVTLGTSPSLTNIISSGSEKLADAVGETAVGKMGVGGITLADVVGGGAQAVADTLTGLGQAKVGSALGSAARAKMPNMAEKTAALQAERAAKERLVNQTADEATQKAVAARAAVQSNADAALTSEASLADAAKQNAQQQAARAKAQIPTAANARGLATSTESSEEIGRKFRDDVYMPKQAASKQAFKDEYDGLLEEARGVESEAKNYKEVAEQIFGTRQEVGEAGFTRPLQSKAETVAAGAKSKLKSLDDIEDEHYQSLKEQTEKAKRQGLDNASILEKELHRRGEELTKGKKPTVEALIVERQRLAAAERAAYEAGNDNLGRQFKELRGAIAKDIDESGEIGSKLSDIDRRYATEHAPFYGSQSEIRMAAERGPEAVIDKLVPRVTDPDRIEKATRLTKFLADDPRMQKQIGDGFIKNVVGDAERMGEELFHKRLQGQWAKYSDNRTGDKVLKSVLGDRYEPMRKLVEQTRTIKPKTIDDTLKEAVKGIDDSTSSRSALFTKQRDSATKTLDDVLGTADRDVAGVNVPGKQGTIEATRTKQLEALKKEFAEKEAKMRGKARVSEMALQTAGLGTTIYGAVGLVMGNPQAVASLVTGGIVLMSRPAVIKLTNTVKGLELLNKSMRAAPGTAAAAANGRLIQRYLNEEKEDNERVR